MKAADIVVDLTVRYGFQVLGALVILAVGALVARWAGRLLDRHLQRRAIDLPMRVLFVRMLRVVVVLMVLVVALDKFGFQIAPLVAGIGVAGVGIGLALQGVLGNVVAGLSIIFTKPFRLGEYIEVGGVHGEVAIIELFSTTLAHPDRSRVIIPNGKIVGEILHNFGAMRRLQLTVTVSHDADLGHALGAARDVLNANARVLKDPTASVGVGQVAEVGVRISIEPWVRIPDVGSATAEIYEAVLERFREDGIPLPVSQHQVKLLQAVAETANAAH